ncbi:MAG: hypothetical protein JXX14_06305 [Deltaproteobacteria bacterium]|nr:hypothetical protein [Deltaproteobacteria bacterium]
MMKLIWIQLMLLLLFTCGCSDDTAQTDDGGTQDTGNDTDSNTPGTDSFINTDSDSGANDDDSDITGDLGPTFRYGINGGHRNAGWSDPVQAQLEVLAGCNSQRISLPERHLDQWGYDIELADMSAYAELGMTDQVAFLTSPIRSHSTAPDAVADWELAYYMPANLYEPAIINGEINPNNYWAKYVYDTVATYKSRIRVWEIWNEPDYTPTWADTLTWWEEAPTAAQLPRFNGSIYAYIRMLRVSKEAATLADPNALIATGGIGYASFLGAILRYTDNPSDGSVSDAFPATGGAYFDVLSFHHYPIYTSGNSDAAVAGYLSHFNELKDTLAEAGKAVAGYENTESGAPTHAVGSYPGNDAYAVNYLMKVMISAHAAGIHGIDWFTLSDSDLNGGGDSSYDYMGLYEDVVNLDDINAAQIKNTGVAYKTLDILLGGASYDIAATNALSLPANVTGHAFVTAAGQTALALWTTVDAAEKGSAAVPINSAAVPANVTVAWNVHHWNHSATGIADILDAPAELTLDGYVTILVAR